MLDLCHKGDRAAVDSLWPARAPITRSVILLRELPAACHDPRPDRFLMIVIECIALHSFLYVWFFCHKESTTSWSSLMTNPKIYFRVVLKKFTFEIFQGWFILLDFQGAIASVINKKLNGEGGIWTLAPLLTTYSLSRGAPSATWVLLPVDYSFHTMLYVPTMMSDVEFNLQRRRWDSNPRWREPHWFSRPAP